MPGETNGTGFASFGPDEGPGGSSGKKRAGRTAIPSRSEVPSFAPPALWCLCFRPQRRGTCFTVQILDLGTGDILDELPQRPLRDLPAVLKQVISWAVCR